MDHRRERFQQQLAEAWNDWNHDTADLVHKAREVRLLTGTDLSAEVARLYATRSALHDELDALWADPDDGALDEHSARVEAALDRFERTYVSLSQRTESMYEKAVHQALTRRTNGRA